MPQAPNLSFREHLVQNVSCLPNAEKFKGSNSPDSLEGVQALRAASQGSWLLPCSRLLAPSLSAPRRRGGNTMVPRAAAIRQTCCCFNVRIATTALAIYHVSTGSRRAGSVIVAHGPSCSVACGILPDQGSNPCGKWGPLFIAVHGPLTIAASLVAEHGLQTRRLSNCGSRA
ncbi:hypothetical protein J1605_001071 [Eschrichtius robustus]|uniref:Uncharacterized protein n=1 Tax=Eschrichtius robustus TaxID=9764 RepID=A0AB34GPB5_ESCRO|nr:hypothetical protein J1605_001071 [Eschrichtius robustus]